MPNPVMENAKTVLPGESNGNGNHSDVDINSFNSTASGWDDPVIPYCLTPPEISADLLPSLLGAYARAVSQETQTPEGLSVMMELSVLATCLQKKFVVSPYGDGYIEPLSLWTITAMPPASRKTAVVNLLTSPLIDWENEQRENLEAEISDIETKRVVNLKAIDHLQSQASKVEDSLERKELIREINALKDDTPDELLPPRLWTGDITPERLQNLMAEHGERMSLISDEGGIFEIMAGLYSGGRANLDVFLKGHAGQSIRVDRGGRTVTLDNPALSFGLAIQPQILSEFGEGGKKRFRGIGTLARFLYCFPKSNIGQRDLDERQSISETDKRIYREEIFKLLNIPAILDDQGKEIPRIIQLSSDSRDKWIQFSKYIESKQGDGGEFEPIQDWTGKLPGASLRIAGLCHVGEYGDSSMPIKLETMERSLDLCQLLIPHTKVSFDLMGVEQDVNDAKVILDWIRMKGESCFKRGDCHKEHHGRFLKVDRLVKALDVLQGWNVISAPEQIKPKSMGRPSIVYHVNPAIQKEVDNGMA